MCSPSRCSIQTGMSPARTAFSGNSGKEITAVEYRQPKGYLAASPLMEPMPFKQIPADTPTIAEHLNELGYRSAHFGKWHINAGGPPPEATSPETGKPAMLKVTRRATCPMIPKRCFASRAMPSVHRAGTRRRRAFLCATLPLRRTRGQPGPTKDIGKIQERSRLRCVVQR